MTMRLKTLSFSVLAFNLVGVSACSPEQPAPVSVTKPMAGAWAQADAFSPDVQEAARFAVQTFAVQNKARVLYKDVTDVRQQVVAGLNFELQLQVTMDGSHRSVMATVWRQVNGAYSLQSWQWLD
jgi:hypothetical protein